MQHTTLKGLTNDFLEIESLGFDITKGRILGGNVDQMHQDYLWKRSEFFLQIAGLCGELGEDTDSTLFETVMEFSLKVG